MREKLITSVAGLLAITVIALIVVDVRLPWTLGRIIGVGVISLVVGAIVFAVSRLLLPILLEKGFISSFLSSKEWKELLLLFIAMATSGVLVIGVTGPFFSMAHKGPLALYQIPLVVLADAIFWVWMAALIGVLIAYHASGFSLMFGIELVRKHRALIISLVSLAFFYRVSYGLVFRVMCYFRYKPGCRGNVPAWPF